MNIREISDALRINRNSVAKYLDVLTSREEVEFKIFGKSKVYFLSQNVPVSTLIRFSSHLMAILNRDYRIVQINDALLRFLEQPREALIGTLIGESSSPLLDNGKILSWCHDALSGKEMAGEIEVSSGAQQQYFRALLTPTRFQDNTPGIILVFENITEKRRIGAALAESEENFRAMVDESGDGCAIIDDAGEILVWNPAMEQITGIPAGDAVGMPLPEVVSRILVPEHRSKKQVEQMKKAMAAAFHDNELPFSRMPDEFQIMSLGGIRRHIRKLAFPIRVGKKLHSGVIIRDITGRKNIEEELLREKTFQTAIMDSVMGIICIFDDREHLARWNRNMERVTGYSSYELLQMNVSDLIAVEERQSVRDTVKNIFVENVPGLFETLVLTRAGRKIPYLVTIVTTIIGSKKYRVCLGLDISKRKRAEEALQHEKALLTGLLDSIPDLVFFKDLHGVYLGCNAEFARHVGRSPEEITGHTDFDLYPENLARSFRENDELTIRSKKPHHNEEWIDYPDGKRIIVDTLKSPLVSTVGKRIGILGVARDITGRKMAEELIRRSEEKYRRIVETAYESICVMDRTQSITFVNQRFADLLGYTVEEMIGEPITAAMHPDDLEDHRMRIQNRIGGLKEAYERRLVRKDGSTCWVLVSVTPLFDQDGAFEGSFAMLTDITKRREAEQALRVLFRSMVGTTGMDSLKKITGNISSWLGVDCVMVGELRPERTSVNVLAMRLDGKDVEHFSYSLRGTPCENVAATGFCIYPDHARELFPSAKDLADLNIRGYAGTPLRDSGGEVIGILCILSRSPLKTDQVTTEIMDIFAVKASAEIERKRAGDALFASEERFQQVAENAGEWIWEVDPDGLYTYCSAAVEPILGYSPAEIVGKMHYSDLFPETSRRELRTVTEATFARREPFRRFVNPCLHKDGHAIILETNGIPIFDPDGRFRGYRGCDMDLTERRRLEDARKAALEQIEKNIGQLAMLGDHIRNPLTAIQAYAGLMAPEAEEKIAAQVKEIDRIISRIDQGWVESEKVRQHLRKYYDINLPGNPPAPSGDNENHPGGGGK